jgi:hypothetical protein
MTLVVLAMLTGGVVAVVAATWSLVSNRVAALAALVVFVPLFLWGFTQDD